MAIVVFRGTTFLANWIQDLEYYKVMILRMRMLTFGLSLPPSALLAFSMIIRVGWLPFSSHKMRASSTF
jgi:hypothetical protein